MPLVEQAELPAAGGVVEHVRVVYIQNGRSDLGDFAFLQIRKRSMLAATVISSQAIYGKRLVTAPKELAEMVAGPFEAIVAPTSGSPELIEPYFRALREKFPSLRDLSPFVARGGSVEASDSDVSTQDVKRDMNVGSPNLDGISSLLFVDDVFGRGKTAAALLSSLHDAGLNAKCKMTVAVPLFMGPERGPSLIDTIKAMS